MNLYIYEHTTSTNDLGRDPLFKHSDLIWAHEQSAGRGQRGNRWMSGVGQNVTFSVVLEPRLVKAAQQFVISQITALALKDTLAHYGIEAAIKWTNDIYVGEHKIAGVLIENSLHDGCVARSIIGVGLNINQELFDPRLPNPTSMRVVSGRRFDRESVVRLFHTKLMELYAALEANQEAARNNISTLYHKSLYRLGEQHRYRLASGEEFEATIEGVGPQGELQLRHTSGELRGYLFREVGFVIDARGDKIDY